MSMSMVKCQGQSDILRSLDKFNYIYIESRKTAILMIINLKIQRQGQGQDSNDKDDIQL